MPNWPASFGCYWAFTLRLRLEERKPWQLVMVLLCWATTWAGRVDALLLLAGVGLLGLIAATAGKALPAVGDGECAVLCGAHPVGC